MSNPPEVREPTSLENQFSPAQLIRLGEILELTSGDDVIGIAEIIQTSILVCLLKHSMSEAIPNRTHAKNKLLAIANTSLKLATLLRDFDLTDHGTGLIGDETHQLTGISRLLYRKTLWDDDDISCIDLIVLLKNLESNCRALRADDAYLRSYYFLPKWEEVNRDFYASVLWPVLFKIWEATGHTVAQSNQDEPGPTLRFLALIHEVAGISVPPSASALRTAAERWKRDPLREVDLPLPSASQAAF